MLRSLPSAFVEETFDSVGSKSMDRGLDDGLAATEIIGDLLGSGAFHGQFDDEHGFVLPAGQFTCLGRENQPLSNSLKSTRSTPPRPSSSSITPPRSMTS